MCGWAVLSNQAMADAREIRVGIYENPPKITLGSDKQPSGILGDLLGEISRQEGWTLRASPCSWQECLDALEARQIDLLPDVAFSEERDRKFDFHMEPALNGWSAIYVPKGAHIQSVRDLKNKKVAILTGSIQEEYLLKQLEDFGVSAIFVPVKSYEEGFALVSERRADVVVANNYFGDGNAERYGLSSSPLLFLPVRLYYATSEGANADLLAAIDRHLKDWHSRDGSPYFKILGKWLPVASSRSIPAWVIWVLVGLGATVLAVVLVNNMLRNQVRKQTAELREDVVKLREADESLRNSEYRYRSLADTSPLAIQVFAPDGVVLRVNAAWEQLWQARFSDLKDYNVLQDPQLEQLGILPLLKKAFAGDPVALPEHEYHKAKIPGMLTMGSKLWLLVYAYPVFDKDGKILGSSRNSVGDFA